MNTSRFWQRTPISTTVSTSEPTNAEWTEEESIHSEFQYGCDNDYFGARISLSKDGGNLAIGSPTSIQMAMFYMTTHKKDMRVPTRVVVEESLLERTPLPPSFPHLRHHFPQLGLLRCWHQSSSPPSAIET